MANTHLTRTQVAGNRKKFTLSAWVKRSKLSYNFSMWFCAGVYNSTQMAQCYWATDDKLRFGAWDSNGATNHYITTNRVFRDTNAWYHIVVGVDTTQSTASDRIKLYINGVQETSFYDDGVTEYPTQNFDYPFNDNGIAMAIGTRPSYTGGYHDGYISHLHFCDGYQYAASDFGSTDTTTGEWKIKTSPSVSYGTNGFAVLKDGNTITDQSSNSNDFTVGSGTLTKSEDNPSNIFATFNPLNIPSSNAPIFAAGNTDLDSCNNAGQFHGSSTLGMSSGKFYAEFKWKSNNYAVAGVTSRARNDARENKRPGAENGSYGFELYNGNVKVNNSTIGGFSGSSLSIGDILCIAIDCDNNKLYFRKNGDAWMNSGDPTSGSTGTGAISLTAAGSGDYDGFWFFEIGDGDTSSSSKISANFGNGYFLTTAVSSAGTNASGIGIFEYDVPAGYTALCTKGLNE